MPPTGVVAKHVLPTYYATVVSLRTYVERVRAAAIPSPDLSRNLILDGLVALPCSLDEHIHQGETDTYGLEANDYMPLESVVGHVQRTLHIRRRHDMLLLGFHVTPHRMIATHTNSIVHALLTDDAWNSLLFLLGTHAFVHMLCGTTYYYPMAPHRDCYSQMWGMPLTDQRPLTRGPPSVSERHVSAAHLFFRRSRLFYARPVQVYRYGIVLGLPPTHTFHMHGHTHTGRRGHTARIMRDMQPHAFGLPHAWHRLPSKNENHDLPRRRWPRGLTTLAHLVSRMLQKHRRCRYDVILEACCPRQHLVPTMSVPSCSPPEVLSQQTTSARSPPLEPGSSAPPLLSYATPPSRVTWYVCVVLRTILPRDMVGSPHNWAVVRRTIRRFVHARRLEKISVHEALQGFRKNECAWLQEYRDPVQTHTRLCAWMWWLLDDVVLPLLRTCFYVTDSAVFRRRVLYFRQDVWAQQTRPHVHALCMHLFSRVQTPMDAPIPYATMRLVPKEASVRPIVNLARRPMGFGRSINAQLQGALDVLSYEAAQQSPRIFGAAMPSIHAVYARLKAYKQRFQGRWPRLYMVRADIRAAFDSLDHTRLLHLVRALVPRHATYVLQRHAQIRPGIGMIRRTQVRRAWPAPHPPSFLEQHAAQSAPPPRHAVLVDGVTYTTIKAEDVLARVEAHIQCTLVRIGNALHRQTTGIPQGSILSTLLCNLVLADAERTYLSIDEDEDCLLRFTDDFLYVSPSYQRAYDVCQALHRGFPLHGCRIAPEKSLVNFDACLPTGHVVRRLAAHTPFPWCGICIDPTTLAIQPDTQRYPRHMGDTLTVRAAGLTSMLVHAMHPRAAAVYTDTHLNTPYGVYTNLLEGFVFAAAKLRVFMRHMPFAYAPPVMRAIVHAVRLTWNMIRAAIREARAMLHPHAQCHIQRACVEWIGYFAFAHVLQRWPVHAPLVAALMPFVHAQRYARSRRKIGPLVLRAWTAQRERIRRLT